MSRNIPGAIDSKALALLSGKSPSADVLALLDRARYDVQRGWTAAALDALKRAVKALEEAS